MDKPSLQFSPNQSRSGFSLVEVALAIGIIAFAFVSLFALMPTGLNTFRSAIDTSNETWIMQGMNSMIQTTDFIGVEDFAFKKSGEIFYFDEEAKLTDREKQDPPGSDAAKRARLYAVKLVIDKLNRPNGATAVPRPEDLMTHGWRVIVVFAQMQNPTAMTDFGKVDDAKSLQNLPKETPVRSRTFFVARMDSEVKP